MNLYSQHGLVDGYWKVKDVYPPGTFTILSGAVELGDMIGAERFVSFKIFQGTFFIISSFLAYYACRNITLTLIFQISIFVNALIFSSVDIFFVPFLMLTLMALQKDNFILASFSIAVAILIKWQPVFLTPFLMVFLVQRLFYTDQRLQVLLKSLIPAALVVSFAGLFFEFAFLDKLFVAGSAGSTSFSANTFNLGWIISFYLSDPAITNIQIISTESGSPAIMVMQAIFWLIFVLIIYKYVRLGKGGYTPLLVAMALGEAAFLVLYPGIHATYWIALTVILLFLSESPLGLRLFLYTGLMAGINLLFVYSWKFPRGVGFFDLTILLAAVNCALLFIGLFRYYKYKPQLAGT